MLSFPLLGSWKPGQINVSWTTNSRPIIPDVERLIEQTWEQSSRRPGINLFDGPMCRLESFHTSGDSLHLTLSPTSYKIFMGTNMHHADLADKYGREILANPVGLSAAVISSDNFLMLGRRNASVAYYPSRVHPFAGALEPHDPLDVFAEVRRELREELSITENDIEQMICTGMAEDRSLRQPEMIFAVRAKIDRAQIESQLDAEEHRGVWVSETTRDAVESALNGGEKFTPVAVAAILLWGRLKFGQEWFNVNSSEIGYNVR